MRRLHVIVVLGLLVLSASACSRGQDESANTTVVSTTTASDQGGVPVEGSSTSAVVTTSSPSSDGGEPSVATTTAVVIGIPTYEIVSAVAGDRGDALVVVIDTGAYSNVELENLVFDIVDRFAPAVVLVVDSQEAADLALLELLTDEEETILARHTLISIENGVEVTFLGPYADFPRLTIGS